jgi:hypothetical protein
MKLNRQFLKAAPSVIFIDDQRRFLTMKRRIAYFIGLTFLVMLFSGTVFAAEEASSIMCDNGVVNIGDTDTAVQDACGEPDSQNMNEWVYNFGPSQPVYTVIFKEGQVVRILENEWGS